MARENADQSKFALKDPIDCNFTLSRDFLVAQSPMVGCLKRTALNIVFWVVDNVTMEELIAAMGWLPHTTRAALTGLKKKGHLVTSGKLDGIRRYRIEGGAG